MRILILSIMALGCVEEATTEMVAMETAGGHTFQIDVFEYPNIKGKEPMHGADLDSAKEACSAQGKRLCTAVEWRRACAGPSGTRRYAYGSSHIPRICHTEVDLPSGHSSMMDASILMAASGAYRDCRTEEGVFDLNGNLEEWVLDSWRGVGGMLEGGAFYTHQEYGDCTGRYSRQPDYRLRADQPVVSAGFRCCLSEREPDESLIEEDAEARLEAAASLSSTLAYDPAREVEIHPGIFMDQFEYPNRPGEMPLRAVHWETAQSQCQAAEKRLCSATEWEEACASGGENQPYGSPYLPGACPIYLSEPVPSGSHPACVTDQGVYDLVGGLWEWTDTPLDADALRNRAGEALREIRGGSWFVDERKGVCRPTDGYPAAPEDVAFPDLGFRCCRGESSPLGASPLPAGVCPEGLIANLNSCISPYEYPGSRGQVPEGDMDWEGAQAACASKSLRVCTEAEWERGCGGPDGSRWPYGNVYDPLACFILDQPPEGLLQARPSGSMADCHSPLGLMDMSGNLWEWTLTSDGQGVLRGGSWDFSAGLGQCRARATAESSFSGAQLGVRCCSAMLDLAPGIEPI